jgi:hypothetical protein
VTQIQEVETQAMTETTREQLPDSGEPSAGRTEIASGAPPAGPIQGTRAPAELASPPAVGARPRVPLYVRLIGAFLILMALGWVLCSLSGAVLALIAGGSQQVSASDTGSLPVSGSPTYVISAGFGSVRLVAGDPGHVSYRLDKSVRALTRSVARRELDRITLAAHQSGDTLALAEQAPGFSWQNALESRSITVTIALPPQATVRITTSAGDLEMSNLTLTGDTQIDQTAGNLTLRHVTIARALTIHSAAGNVDLDDALAGGATLDVHLTAGNLTVTLPHDTSAHLDARADAGNVSVLGWPAIQASGSSASGDLSPQPTGQVTLAVTAGNLTVFSR